jgi:hypothetical protein
MINVYEGRWFFNSCDRSSIDGLPLNLNNLSMILIDSKLKYPLETVERNEFEDILMRVVDGKDKVSIM